MAFPLHDVVVADDPLMHEAADTVETGGCGFTRLPSETAVVVGDKFAQHGVGGVDVGRLGQTQFTGEAILQDAPEAFDAAFGLGTIGSDKGDAELFQGAAELRGLAFSSELFVDGPVVVVADEDAAVIPVEGERYPVSAQHLSKQAEIAEGGFRGEELYGQDLFGGIVLHAESSEALAAAFEPVVRATIELHQFAEPCGTQATLAMSGSAAFAWRAETVLAEQATQSFATEGKALALNQLLVEMVIVETSVGAAGQLHDPRSHVLGQAAVS